MGGGAAGMDYRFDEHAIISENELIKYVERDYLISEVINLENEKLFISFNKNIETNESQLFEASNYNISIVIARAVTAYSRIYMGAARHIKIMTIIIYIIQILIVFISINL